MDNQDKTIQFIDSEYRELFRIPDGGSIRVTFPPDDIRGFAVRECKYLDDTHFEIRGNGVDTYHIAQFAELMEKMGAKYEPAFQLQNVKIMPFEVGDENFLTFNREEGNTCIGHIAGNFGQQGDRFFSSWSDRESGGNTPEFQSELHSAVYALRQDVLKDHATMLAYCKNYPEAKLPDMGDLNHYGFKMDTESRKYFVRCFAETSTKDSRFIVYAYDKAAPLIEREQESVMEQIREHKKAPKPPRKEKSPDKKKSKKEDELGGQ